MRPTFRAKVRVGDKSNTEFRNNSRKAEFLSTEEINGLVMKVKERGAQVIEFAGGEPTLLPSLAEIVTLCRNAGLSVAIATNGTAGKLNTSKLLAAGVREFVVSVYGSDATQEKLLNLKKVRANQDKFCTQVSNQAILRFQYEILQSTLPDIVETAKWMAGFKPLMVDFVLNPYEVWNAETALDMDALELQLNEAVALLEYENIGVNIRHYPLCRLEPIFWKNICNFKHLLVDPYQYDRGIFPRTEQAYLTAGEQFSADYEYKESPCSACVVQLQCGGAPRAIVESIGKGCLKPEDIEGCVSDDPFYFRKLNTGCLMDPRQDSGACDAAPEAVQNNGTDSTAPTPAPVIIRRPESEGQLCVFVVCGDEHQWYLPLFLYNLQREYPEYTPVALVRGEIDPEMLKLCLDADVRQLENDDYPAGEQVTSMLRYALEDDVVKSFPFTLITDFDRLICRGSPSLLDQHLRALEADGTETYENWLLSHSLNPLMQGTHFVTKEWWGKVSSALEEMRETLRSEAGKMMGTYAIQNDGFVVGNIINRAELPLPQKAPKLWRTHGVRMRIWGNIRMNALRLDVWEKALIRQLLADGVFLTLAEECGRRTPDIVEMVKKWRMAVR